MEIQIKKNILAFQIDTDAGVITKTAGVKRRGADGSIQQGNIYVEHKYAGRNCLMILTEPRADSDVKKYFKFNGEDFGYYDVLVREIKSAKTNKAGYMTGKLYVPADWCEKIVKIIVLAD